jgi:hypothetical protein
MRLKQGNESSRMNTETVEALRGSGVQKRPRGGPQQRAMMHRSLSMALPIPKAWKQSSLGEIAEGATGG